MTDEAPTSTRPPFAVRYPDDPTLARALEAFSSGNFRQTRAIAATLEAHADPAVANAAKDLLARTAPDPIAPVLLGTTALLLVALTLWAMTQSHRHLDGPTAPRPSPSATK
jgi:hypothetical protein